MTAMSRYDQMIDAAVQAVSEGKKTLVVCATKVRACGVRRAIEKRLAMPNVRDFLTVQSVDAQRDGMQPKAIIRDGMDVCVTPEDRERLQRDVQHMTAFGAVEV